MTGVRGIVSAFIAFHLVAVAVDSVPEPNQLPALERKNPTNDHPLSAALTPILDRLDADVRVIEPIIASAIAPLRIITQPYEAISLRQKWNMFSNPAPVDQYLRVDHYVLSQGSPKARVYEELVLPAQREDEPRFVHKFRDKAVLIAQEAFFNARAKEPKTGKPPGDLRPLVRYFRNRFVRSYLRPDEHVVRTEVWRGEAPIPPLDQRVSNLQFEMRSAVLERYWEGPSERAASTVTPQPGAVQHEADIVWTLDYAEEP